jgi:hypothetical protein
MRATDVVGLDHTRMSEAIARLQAPAPRRTHQRRLDELTRELAMHRQVTEAIFYPAVRRVSDRTEAAAREHELIETLLADLRERDPRSQDFAPLAIALQDALRHHAHEEETALFPEAERLGGAELERLGGELLGRKRTVATVSRSRSQRMGRPTRQAA